MNTRILRRAGLAVAIFLTAAIAVVALGMSVATMTEPSPAPGRTATPAATASTSATAGASTPRASGRIDPPLPAFVGAIGDSISVAFDAAPQFGPQPGHAWTLGTTKGDGVFSLLERFEALGGHPLTVDAAVAGARMRDATSQAKQVVAGVADLPAGSTAFVTIELGGNDACAATPLADFERQLRSAVSVLRAGLPAGSRLLILSVPNIVALRQLTADVAEAQNVYATFGLCRAYLAPTVTQAALTAGGKRIVAYNEILRRVCAEIQASDGKTGKLYCRSDQDSGRSMYSTRFTLADVSTLDYFHPSVSGQALIADGAWKAAYWSAVTLPAVTDGLAWREVPAAG